MPQTTLQAWSNELTTTPEAERQESALPATTAAVSAGATSPPGARPCNCHPPSWPPSATGHGNRTEAPIWIQAPVVPLAVRDYITALVLIAEEAGDVPPDVGSGVLGLGMWDFLQHI